MSGPRVRGIVPLLTFLLSITSSMMTRPNETLAFDLPAEISDPDSLNSAEDLSGTTESADEPGYGIHLQVGALYRFAHSLEDYKVNHLLTADLSLVNWNHARSTWGAGAHLAIDDFGHRIGFKGIWRTPLSDWESMYLQVAPGIYVSSEDESFKPKLPGYFLEVEIGIKRGVAVVFAGEFLPYETRQTVSYDPNRPYDPDQLAEFYESGTSTAFFAGAKLAQWWAIAAVAVAATIVALGTIESPGIGM